jgi:hypothetical protein
MMHQVLGIGGVQPPRRFYSDFWGEGTLPDAPRLKLTDRPRRGASGPIALAIACPEGSGRKNKG